MLIFYGVGLQIRHNCKSDTTEAWRKSGIAEIWQNRWRLSWKFPWNILWINVKGCKTIEHFFNIWSLWKAPKIAFVTHWLSNGWKGCFKRASFSVQKSLFWKVKEPLSQRESGTFVFSLCGEYFSFTFVNCFTELKFHAERVFSCPAELSD